LETLRFCSAPWCFYTSSLLIVFGVPSLPSLAAQFYVVVVPEGHCGSSFLSLYDSNLFSGTHYSAGGRTPSCPLEVRRGEGAFSFFLVELLPPPLTRSLQTLLSLSIVFSRAHVVQPPTGVRLPGAGPCLLLLVPVHYPDQSPLPWSPSFSPPSHHPLLSLTSPTSFLLHFTFRLDTMAPQVRLSSL